MQLSQACGRGSISQPSTDEIAFFHHALDDGERGGQHLGAVYQMSRNLVHVVKISSPCGLMVQPRCFKLPDHLSPRPHGTIKALEYVSEDKNMDRKRMSFQDGNLAFENSLTDEDLSIIFDVKAENRE
jgi:hypothetical protein